jgi:hypothetical protein
VSISRSQSGFCQLAVLLILAVARPAFAASLASEISPAALVKVAKHNALRSAHGRGTLIDVHTQEGSYVLVIAVHGIAGTPSDLAPVMEKEIAAGHAVKAFVYDDKFRSLEDSSLDLALAIQQCSVARPEMLLRIYAHSGGGRVAIRALALLAVKGELAAQVELELIAVPLAGVKSANFIRLLPRFLPWVRSLGDVATRSEYQRQIEQVRLPETVHVNVFAGEMDTVFSYSTDKYRALVNVLHGTLRVIPKATHMSAVEEVARMR